VDLADRVGLRRFVGRELLLWLWFESELFDATLATKAHGSFGMWIEGRLVLSSGREITQIRGSAPGRHREAKESLRRGKLPELATFHLSWADHESTFTLKGEPLAISGLVLPTVLGDDGDEAPPALAPAPRQKARAVAPDERYEVFYERMRLTRQVEEIVEALYRDFLTLRLGDGWRGAVLPALAAWVAGEDVGVDRYRAARARARRA
jgi:hypothetical protein